MSMDEVKSRLRKKLESQQKLDSKLPVLESPETEKIAEKPKEKTKGKSKDKSKEKKTEIIAPSWQDELQDLVAQETAKEKKKQEELERKEKQRKDKEQKEWKKLQNRKEESDKEDLEAPPKQPVEPEFLKSTKKSSAPSSSADAIASSSSKSVSSSSHQPRPVHSAAPSKPQVSMIDQIENLQVQLAVLEHSISELSKEISDVNAEIATEQIDQSEINRKNTDLRNQITKAQKSLMSDDLLMKQLETNRRHIDELEWKRVKGRKIHESNILSLKEKKHQELLIVESDYKIALDTKNKNDKILAKIIDENAKASEKNSHEKSKLLNLFKNMLGDQIEISILERFASHTYTNKDISHVEKLLIENHEKNKKQAMAHVNKKLEQIGHSISMIKEQVIPALINLEFSKTEEIKQIIKDICNMRISKENSVASPSASSSAPVATPKKAGPKKLKDSMLSTAEFTPPESTGTKLNVETVFAEAKAAAAAAPEEKNKKDRKLFRR
jgi:hypothetical protein